VKTVLFFCSASVIIVIMTIAFLEEVCVL